MLKLEKALLDDIILHFHKNVLSNIEIDERIKKLHENHELLLFDPLHQLYHSFKDDINYGWKPDIGYILYKLDNLNIYLKKKHKIFSGKNFIPTLLNSLLLYNKDIQKIDGYTAKHSKRVSVNAVKIGEGLKFNNHDLFLLEISGQLHDTGKIKIAESILKKRDKFTEEEYVIMKRHPQYGYDILDKIFPIERVKFIVRGHHERLDGSGYPDGLMDKNIDLLTKIITVADGYDAMTHGRGYRAALSKKRAKEELYDHSGKVSVQFDRKVVEVAVNVL